MKQIKQKIFPITKQILMAIANHVSDTIQNSAEFAPHHGFNRFIFGDTISFKDKEKFQERQKIKRALYKLKKQKSLETKKVGDKILYKLTTKGLHQVLLSKIKMQTKTLSNNQYCLICFDIPESARYLRRALRRILKNMQFKQLQKSVWYTNKDIFDLLTLYIQNLQASDWIKVVLASKIE